MREQVGSDGVNRADLQWRIELILAVLRHILDHAHLVQNPLGLLNDTLANLGHPNTAFAALEQGDTELILKLFNRNAKGRLADMTALCGTAKMPFPGKRNNVS